MREIKFRAWDLEQSTMHEIDGFIQFKEFTEIHFDPSGFKKGKFLLMQYAGMNDFDGRPIFEGDIIRGFDGKVGVVDFINGYFQWNGSPLVFEPEEGFEVFPTENWAKVIGNIYEHPNLQTL